MLIESLIQRENGTVVEFNGGVSYHFKPSVGGAHVCEVDDPAHIERLLSIREGFRAVDTEPEGTETPNVPHVLQGDGGVGVAGEVDASPAVPRKAARRRKTKPE